MANGLRCGFRGRQIGPRLSARSAMPSRQHPQVEPTEDWSQLRLHFTWAEQCSYELIRPVVLFGRSPAERAQETGAAARTIYRKVHRFDRLGMAGLFAEESSRDPRALPPTIRRAIVELKAEYAAFRPHELATICFIRFDRRPSPHTLQRILAE